MVVCDSAPETNQLPIQLKRLQKIDQFNVDNKLYTCETNCYAPTFCNRIQCLISPSDPSCKFCLATPTFDINVPEFDGLTAEYREWIKEVLSRLSVGRQTAIDKAIQFINQKYVQTLNGIMSTELATERISKNLAGILVTRVHDVFGMTNISLTSELSPITGSEQSDKQESQQMESAIVNSNGQLCQTKRKIDIADDRQQLGYKFREKFYRLPYGSISLSAENSFPMLSLNELKNIKNTFQRLLVQPSQKHKFASNYFQSMSGSTLNPYDTYNIQFNGNAKPIAAHQVGSVKTTYPLKVQPAQSAQLYGASDADRAEFHSDNYLKWQFELPSFLGYKASYPTSYWKYREYPGDIKYKGLDANFQFSSHVSPLRMQTRYYTRELPIGGPNENVDNNSRTGFGDGVWSTHGVTNKEVDLVQFPLKLVKTVVENGGLG